MAFAAFTSFAESSFSEVSSPNVLINISGEQVNTSLGNITITANGAITIQTGPEIALDVNLGTVAVGLGSFLDITGQELDISQGEEIITASATTVMTGQQIASSVNSVVTQAGSTINISGELANIVSNTISISEGSGIVLTGQQILSNLGDTIISGSASMLISGQLANTVVNSITVGQGGNAVINGQQLNSNSGTVSVTGTGIITADGIEINVNAATLRFWDPIVDDNTENWTNI